MNRSLPVAARFICHFDYHNTLRLHGAGGALPGWLAGVSYIQGGSKVFFVFGSNAMVLALGRRLAHFSAMPGRSSRKRKILSDNAWKFVNKTLL